MTESTAGTATPAAVRSSVVPSASLPAAGKVRVVIENVAPQVDCGRFPIKRVTGEAVLVEADVFCDGHDGVACRVLYRYESDSDWEWEEMTVAGNDRWAASFRVESPGRYVYTVAAWVDHFGTWSHDLVKRHDAEQDLFVEFQRGAALARAAAARAPAAQAAELNEWAGKLEDASQPQEERFELALDENVAALMDEHPDPELMTRHAPELEVVVDRERARYSTWYELFPRSCAVQPGAHGTLRDVEARLPYIAEMGFDVLYLPPIHPIGGTDRKGPNNKPVAAKSDPGSPWGIGAADGGHKAVHPQLGTLEDLRHLAARAAGFGIELALDIAFQCSPDHPYVQSHPEWFLRRPDGTIQFAENPPKKYQDILPFFFETQAWRELWQELESIVRFWAGQGIRIFRVDNPHTKPFGLWQWLIAQIKREHPDAIFLAEAFTRPKVMHRLAKLGFTQSYTYFAWRNTKSELIDYFTELTAGNSREYFRPNLWPNTPDILTEQLQFGGRPAFMTRLVLAATLGANYGIYGPAFELMEHEPREPGSEEYLDSEKYQMRHWDLDRPDSLRHFIARVNRIRRDNPALHSDWGLRFHGTDNDTLICYSKSDPEGDNVVLAIVNLDPHHTQSGWITLDLEELGLEAERSFQAHDLLSGARFLWQGPRNFVALDPQSAPAHVFGLRRRVRSEHDFDYFL
jgi:starch synthase (maltosyl-transferring)